MLQHGAQLQWNSQHDCNREIGKWTENLNQGNTTKTSINLPNSKCTPINTHKRKKEHLQTFNAFLLLIVRFGQGPGNENTQSRYLPPPSPPPKKKNEKKKSVIFS